LDNIELAYVVLGCVMEVYSIMIVTLPIIFPIIQVLEFDPIWTPPKGMRRVRFFPILWMRRCGKKG